MLDTIIIKGAKEHNLKDISLELPKNELIVLRVFQVRENLRLRLIRFLQKGRDVI